MSRRNLKASETVARDIVNFITEGGFSEGDKLPREQAMQKQFGVGRTSLREGLRLLEVQGLISLKPGADGGPVVGAAQAAALGRTLSLFFRMTRATYEDVSDALLILAPLMARRAAQNPARKMVETQLKAVLALGEQQAGTTEQSVRNEAEFHRVLNELGGNPILSLITASLGDLFNEHVVVTSDASRILHVCQRDHRKIMEAVVDRDSELAENLMIKHMKRLLDFHRTQVPAMFSQLIQWR